MRFEEPLQVASFDQHPAPDFLRPQLSSADIEPDRRRPEAGQLRGLSDGQVRPVGLGAGTCSLSRLGCDLTVRNSSLNMHRISSKSGSNGFSVPSRIVFILKNFYIRASTTIGSSIHDLEPGCSWVGSLRLWLARRPRSTRYQHASRRRRLSGGRVRYLYTRHLAGYIKNCQGRLAERSLGFHGCSRR